MDVVFKVVAVVDSEATMQAVKMAVTVLVTVMKASDVGRTIFN